MSKSSKNWLQGINPSSSTPGRVRRRRVVVVITCLLGIVLSWASFHVWHDRTQGKSQLKFEQESARIASDMETSFNLSLEHLRSIPAYFAASDDVSGEKFREFVTPTLQRNSSQYVSAYLPRIAASEIADFEAAARAQGLNDFVVRSVDSVGKPLPLKPREFYFPIYFVAPAVPQVLGFDVGSHPEQARYAAAACNSDEPVVTHPLSLIEDPEDVLSVMALMAVPSAKLSGFRGTAEPRQEGAESMCDGLAVVILKVRPLVEVSLGSRRLEDFQVVLGDPDAEASRQLVYKNFPGEAETIHQSGWPITEREVRFADQTWTLTLAPAAGSVYAPRSPPYWILIVGCLLSLLAAYSLSVTIAIGGLRKQVDRALQLGQYRLGAKLGEGGMGTVYEASHEMLARPAAIKLIRTDNSEASQRWQGRFEREAQATAGLQSPHTVSIYDFGKTQDGTFFYVMERLDGVDLATLVERDGPLPPARAVHLLRQVCQSLAEAHASGLIHRDIKPANIFVCRHALESDFVKVLDFGLVKASQREPSVELTQAGTLLGTPAYMAPEMIQDQAADPRSDIYSLGCVAYFMLTGRPVFEGSLSAIIAGHVKEPPPKINTDGPDQPSTEIEQVILGCLAKSPDDRPCSAIELAAQLAACPLDGEQQQVGTTRHDHVGGRGEETNGDRSFLTTSLELKQRD